MSEPAGEWTPERVSAGLLRVAAALERLGRAEDLEVVELVTACRRGAGMVLGSPRETTIPGEPRRCRGCGSVLEGQRLGRPREWCGGRGRCAKSRAKSGGRTIAA